MERSVSTWNEQILSRRRGLSGRFMSLSKRWTPFGSSRNSTSASPSSNSNYDSLQGFYRPDAPEAIMRRLADYCFMLRDWKLALSTYDILRTDFQNDKAWRHYAGASEMAALSALMTPTPLSSKNRSENIDAWIDAASYSYTDRQRSAAPYYALRTLALSTELLRLRGSSAADDAARWATRILETGLVGSIGHALVTERISASYSIRTGIGIYRLGNRRRKAVSKQRSVLISRCGCTTPALRRGREARSSCRLKRCSVLSTTCGSRSLASDSVTRVLLKGTTTMRVMRRMLGTWKKWPRHWTRALG